MRILSNTAVHIRNIFCLERNSKLIHLWKEKQMLKMQYSNFPYDVTNQELEEGNKKKHLNDIRRNITIVTTK